MSFQKSKRHFGVNHPASQLAIYTFILYFSHSVIRRIVFLTIGMLMLVERVMLWAFPSIGYLLNREDIETAMQLFQARRGEGSTWHFLFFLQYLWMFYLLAIPFIYSLFMPKDNRWNCVFRRQPVSLKGCLYVASAMFVGMQVLGMTTVLIEGTFFKVISPEMLEALKRIFKRQLEQSESSSKFYAILREVNSVGRLGILFFVGAIMPGFVEEVLYRGFFQVMMGRVIKNHHITIFITGFIFSLWHGHLPGLVHRTLGGMFLGYVYVWTGSFVYPCLAHFVNNSIGYLIYFSLSNQDISEVAESVKEGGGFPVQAFVIWGMLFAFLCRKMMDLRDADGCVACDGDCCESDGMCCGAL